MKNSTDTLEQLDQYFQSKSESEKWLIILLVAATVGYLIYSYVYPYASDRYKEQIQLQKILKKQIKENETYLKSITVKGDRTFYLKKYDREIAMEKKRLQLYRKRIAVLNQEFQNLSQVLFNRENWSQFLDSITKRAAEDNVKILDLTNKYVNDKKRFGHVLEIGIKCEGKFQDILSFINDLEQNKLVTDVYHSELKSDPTKDVVVSDLNVSVWGMNR